LFVFGIDGLSRVDNEDFLVMEKFPLLISGKDMSNVDLSQKVALGTMRSSLEYLILFEVF
jgi:hypothetical protein